MTQYSGKSALVAEIKRYKHKADERLKMKDRTLSDDMKDLALQNLCGNLLHFIDTLEVKEVDLEKEFDKCCENYIFDDECDAYIARRFFELGFKTQKGE